MNPNAIASYALILELQKLGVTTAVVSPGSRSMPLTWAANELLDVLVVIDERDAGFCALGIAESTNNPVVVITTSGSAPTHLFPSVTEAYGSSVPLVVISSDRPHDIRGRGAPQTIDQIELFSTHVQYFLDTPIPRDEPDPKHWARIAKDLYSYATGTADSKSCPGPVHLNMGFDEELVPDGDEKDYVSGALSEVGLEEKPKRTFGFSQENVKNVHTVSKNVEAVLTNAKRVLFAFGRNGVPNDIQASELLGFDGFTILADVTSQLRNSDSVIYNYDFILRANNQNDLKPDLVIQIGEPLTSKKFNEWIAGTKTIAVKPFDDLRNPYGNVSETIVSAGIAETLNSIVGMCAQNDEFKGLWGAASETVSAISESVINQNPKSEPAMFFELGKVLQSAEVKTNILLGSSMPVRFGEWFWPKLNENLSVFSHRGTNGIDGVISSAFGIAKGSEKQTICVCGDVTFAHDIGFLTQCVALSKQYELNLSFVVIDNDGGAIFKHLKQGESEVLADSYEKLVATPTKLDFEALTLACGAKYEKFDITNLQGENGNLFHGSEAGTTVYHTKFEYDSGYEFMKELNKVLESD